MLAQKFKTPAELGIPSEQLDALVKVLGMLERGEIKHERTGDKQFTGRSPRHGPMFFNMTLWREEFVGCGTICCIGGLAEAVGQVQFPYKHHLSDSLLELFYPPENLCWYEDITTTEAATALRNYLTTGDACWSEALAEPSHAEGQ